MESIYRFGSQENLRQDIYLTQGVNETNGAFACRFSGLKLRFAEPDSFLRRMSCGSSNSSQGNFKECFGYFSALDDHHSLSDVWVSAAQPYYSHKQSVTLKRDSSGNNNRAWQASFEQPELQLRYRETSFKQTKTVFQRLLSFLARCFMPCIKVKK